LEYGVLRKTHPIVSARLALAAHPIGAALLLLLGPAWAPVFAILHGAGNGIMTIVKGALPLALFGSVGYGARQGWIMMPARLSMALAPWLFGLILTHWDQRAILLTLGLTLVSFLLMLLIRKP
jgi:MFS family permease